MSKILGLNPLYVASEGKLAAVVAPEIADKILERMRRNEGQNVCIIGEIKCESQGLVSMKTGFGGTRIIDTLAGEQLPRIS